MSRKKWLEAREAKPEQSGGKGGKCDSNSVNFVLICCLKSEGMVMLEIIGRIGGGKGK